MRAAAKAVINLLSGTDGKARRFFIMKRATCRIIRASFFQRNTFIYHVDDINTVQKFLDKRFWNHKREYKAREYKA